MKDKRQDGRVDEVLYSRIVYDQQSEALEASNEDKFFVLQSGQARNDSFSLRDFFREAMLQDEESGRFVEDDYNEWMQRVFFDGKCESMYRGELTVALCRYLERMIEKKKADLLRLKAAHSVKRQGSISAEVSLNGIALVEKAVQFYERLHRDWIQRKSQISVEQIDWESKQKMWETLKK